MNISGAIAAIITASLLIALGGCGGDDSRRLTVAIAASLEPAFTEIAAAFESSHPGVTVSLEPGSSSALAARIADGAPFAVLAGADRSAVEALGGARSGPVRVFAVNRLALAVPPGNPQRIRTVADLLRLRVVALCDEAAPCGRYAADLLAGAGVTIPESRVSRAPDAAATLRAVTRGDADAAVVYATDARSAGAAATSVAIPRDRNETVRYGIAPLSAAPDPVLARAFVEAVTAPDGRIVLARYGFDLP